jgi:hypothetical protein
MPTTFDTYVPEGTSMQTDTTNQNPHAEADSGRDQKGRFKEGNKGGPGNPFGGLVALMRAAILQTVTAADIAEIFLALMSKAKEGNLQAAKLVLSYTLGKPRPFTDDDFLEGLHYMHERNRSRNDDVPPSPSGSEAEGKGQAPSTNGDFNAEEMPSTNGDFSAEAPPSTNGDFSAEATPSTNGDLPEEPSSNGEFSTEEPPLTNGVFVEPPLTNGGFTPAAPKLNRQQRRKQERAERLAKKQRKHARSAVRA